jgi:3-phenylpropionate/cinnamic acid dioxygenase small subunit
VTVEIISAPTAVDAAHAAFLYLECRLADEARYAEWEDLWDDEALYWVPMHEDADPEREVSYIYDNRPRIVKRIAQLKTGYRHSQTPPSKMRRLLSNLEVIENPKGAADTVTIASNFVLFEYRFAMTIWAGRYVHTIATGGPTLKLRTKTVHLVNGDAPVSTMAFLI